MTKSEMNLKTHSLARVALLLVVLVPLGASTAFGIAAAAQKANALELKGHFKEAAQTLSVALKTAPPSERKELEFELDRLERIKKDFPYTKDELFAELKNSVKDLTSEE